MASALSRTWSVLSTSSLLVLAACSGADNRLGNQSCGTSLCGDADTVAPEGGSADAGATGQAFCSTSVACGSGGQTYQQCKTFGSDGSCASTSYQLSSGAQFMCNACGDCSAAIGALQSTCSAGAGDSTKCTDWTTCGASNLRVEQCTTSAGGACQGTAYKTSNAHVFACATCEDCNAAFTSAQGYCNSQVQPTTTCTAAAACGPTGVTSQLCTTTQGGICGSQYYTTSNGQSFTCSGCDCTAASSNLATYCGSLGGMSCGTSTCAASQLCCSCSGSLGCYDSGGDSYTCATYGCQ